MNERVTKKQTRKSVDARVERAARLFGKRDVLLCDLFPGQKGDPVRLSSNPSYEAGWESCWVFIDVVRLLLWR